MMRSQRWMRIDSFCRKRSNGSRCLCFITRPRWLLVRFTRMGTLRHREQSLFVLSSLISMSSPEKVREHAGAIVALFDAFHAQYSSPDIASPPSPRLLMILVDVLAQLIHLAVSSPEVHRHVLTPLTLAMLSQWPVHDRFVQWQTSSAVTNLLQLKLLTAFSLVIPTLSSEMLQTMRNVPEHLLRLLQTMQHPDVPDEVQPIVADETKLTMQSAIRQTLLNCVGLLMGASEFSYRSLLRSLCRLAFRSLFVRVVRRRLVPVPERPPGDVHRGVLESRREGQCEHQHTGCRHTEPPCPCVQPAGIVS